MTPTRRYALLFDRRMRAAQLACLGLAQLTREDGWPDPRMVCDFARLYGVPAAELSAFFGRLYVAPDRATPAMRKAFGFLGLATDVIDAESRPASA